MVPLNLTTTLFTTFFLWTSLQVLWLLFIILSKQQTNDYKHELHVSESDIFGPIGNFI